MLHTYIQSIRKKIRKGLPGKSAHQVMAVTGSRLKAVAPDHAKKAGVMILLYPNDNRIHLTYILRKSIQGDVHKGQISFPGGKMEDQDHNNVIITSIRETQEEIGVEVPKENIIASLTPLYIPVSNFLVHPTIGYVDYKPDFVLEEKELEDIIEVPVDYMLDPDIKNTQNITISTGLQIPNVPFYDLKGHTLWGATAMITAEFLELIR